MFFFSNNLFHVSTSERNLLIQSITRRKWPRPDFQFSTFVLKLTVEQEEVVVHFKLTFMCF